MNQERSRDAEQALRDFFERRLGSDIATFTERELPEVYARLDRRVADNVLFARVARLVVQLGLIEDGTLLERLRDEFSSEAVRREIDELASHISSQREQQVGRTSAQFRSAGAGAMSQREPHINFGSRKWSVSIGWGCITIAVATGAAAVALLNYLYSERPIPDGLDFRPDIASDAGPSALDAGPSPQPSASESELGVLLVRTRPMPETALVDGKLWTGSINKIALEPGVSHRITLSKHGYDSLHLFVTLERGESRPVEAVLRLTHRVPSPAISAPPAP